MAAEELLADRLGHLLIEICPDSHIDVVPVSPEGVLQELVFAFAKHEVVVVDFVIEFEAEAVEAEVLHLGAFVFYKQHRFVQLQYQQQFLRLEVHW